MAKKKRKACPQCAKFADALERIRSLCYADRPAHVLLSQVLCECLAAQGKKP